MTDQPDTQWPPCMAPDGAEPCEKYKKLVCDLEYALSELKDRRTELWVLEQEFKLYRLEAEGKC